MGRGTRRTWTIVAAALVSVVVLALVAAVTVPRWSQQRMEDRGEWFGQGLGSSVEKLHYLPEAHTDFLLAVIGEELGFVGVACVIAAFFWISRRLFHIGRQSTIIQILSLLAVYQRRVHGHKAQLAYFRRA